MAVILLIDNYDSFTYNLWQYLRMLGQEVVVYRHDAISVAEATNLDPALIILSPGPRTPDDAGICLDLVRQCHQTHPILGICLGHQVIAQQFGGTVIRSPEPVHGKTCQISHTGKGVFSTLPSPTQVTRYHSLMVEAESLPSCFDITATTAEGRIMGIQHRVFPLEGVQFHPEAILTDHGLTMLRNAVIHAVAWKEQSC